MQRFWLWIGRGADLAQLITVGLAIPAALGVVAWWLSHVLGVPDSALTVGVVSYFVLPIGLTVVALAARRQASRSPNLDVEPTGGPSQDVRLTVTNRGHKTDHQGTAAVVTTRNYQNRHRQGSYTLLWLGRDTNIVALPRDASPVAIQEASYIAALHGADLSKVAQAAPAQIRTIRPLEQPLSTEEIARLQASGTPPDDLWVKLAKVALDEVSKENRASRQPG